MSRDRSRSRTRELSIDLEKARKYRPRILSLSTTLQLALLNQNDSPFKNNISEDIKDLYNLLVFKPPPVFDENLGRVMGGRRDIVSWICGDEFEGFADADDFELPTQIIKERDEAALDARKYWIAWEYMENYTRAISNDVMSDNLFSTNNNVDKYLDSTEWDKL